jgi:hypothetical protein
MTNVELTEQPATVAAPPRTARSKKPAAKKPPSKKTAAPKAKKAAKSAESKKPAEATAPRAGSKGAKILALIGRTSGASLAAIMKATGWQAHSVRGFLSIARSKHGLKIESARNEKGGRVYRVGNYNKLAPKAAGRRAQ